MANDEDELTDLTETLIGRRRPSPEQLARAEAEGVPAYLLPKYHRESAAQRAAELPHLPPRLTAALLRAAFEDEEEDVRTAARHALIVRDVGLGDVVHLALTMDRDPYVREASMDEALEVSDDERRRRLIQQAVEALRDDDCEWIRARVLDFERALELRGGVLID